MSHQLTGFAVIPVLHIGPALDLPGILLASFADEERLVVRLFKVTSGYEVRVGSGGRCYRLLYGPADEQAAWDTYRWVTEPRESSQSGSRHAP